MRVPPPLTHPCSHRHYRHSRSCCLWNWQAASGRPFDLGRNHHDALNWYRFVPYCCGSEWNIWSMIPVPGRYFCLPATSSLRPKQTEAESVDLSEGCACVVPPCHINRLCSILWPDISQSILQCFTLTRVFFVPLCLLSNFNSTSKCTCWHLKLAADSKSITTNIFLEIIYE